MPKAVRAEKAATPRRATREYRDLTAEEQARRQATLAEAERDKESLLAWGRRLKGQSEARLQRLAKTQQAPRGSLGDRLKRLRLAKKLSQHAVAHAAAATPLARRSERTSRGLQSALSQIEAGVTPNPGVLTLAMLCRGMGVSLAELVQDL